MCLWELPVISMTFIALTATFLTFTIAGFSALSDARPTVDQVVAGSIHAGSGNILSWILITKYFLRSFSSFRWFKKGSRQFLAKECAQVLVNRLEDLAYLGKKCG